MQFKRNFGVLRHFCGQYRVDEGHTVIDYFRGLKFFLKFCNVLVQFFDFADFNIAADIEQNVFQIVALYGNLSVGFVQSGVVLYLILLHFFEVSKLHTFALYAKLVVE